MLAASDMSVSIVVNQARARFSERVECGAPATLISIPKR
jgi:hypothetical protein